MAIQTKTMKVKSDTALAETTTTIRDTVTFDTSKLPNGITYKGLKAVLSFADPIQWNKASTYDSLTVVWDDATHASYASKRPIPQNIELTNEFYWHRTADLDAQVEMYRQEVMRFDGRITANANAIVAETNRAEKAEKTLEANIASKESSVLIIGNSYSVGFDATSEQHSLRYNLGDTFDHVSAYGESAAGFVKHYADGHDKSFSEMLTTWANKPFGGQTAEDITHVIFNIAVGDSYALVKMGYSSYTDAFKAAVQDCVTKVKTLFPNIKRIGVMYMDSLSKTTRKFTDSDGAEYYVNLQDMIQLYNFIRPYLVNDMHIDFYGWCGWSLIATKFMTNSDNIHPTPIDGYNAMVQSWKQCYRGIQEWRNFNFNYTIPVSDKSYIIRCSFINPELMVILMDYRGINGATFKNEPEYSIEKKDLPFWNYYGLIRFNDFFRVQLNYNLRALNISSGNTDSALSTQYDYGYSHIVPTFGEYTDA